VTQTITAVVNQKGGVGKTTTAINVAAQLATSGKQVLLIDFDPQGNATGGLGFSKNQSTVTVYDLLMGHAKLNDALQQTTVKNLTIITSNPDLSGAEIELVSKQGREYTLKTILASAKYDYVIIDCPPSLGLLTINALTAATNVLIPVQAEYYALEGLSQLLTTIQAVRQSTNPNLELLGVLLTMYDKRTTLSSQVKTEVEQYFGDQLFSTTVPRNIRLAEAPSFGQTVFQHDKWSKGAKAYKSLVKEILDRTKPS
jgi:chromosome partitioning protein